MSSMPKTAVSTKFYQEDIVQRISDSKYAVVLRCWHDSDDMQPLEASEDPLLRPLRRGEVGVAFFPHHDREILPESDFILVDRHFQTGDVCKRNFEDVQSAVVTFVDVKFQVAHAISGAHADGWKTIDDVRDLFDVCTGDYVEYDDWVGQVTEMFDESIIEVADGSLVRLPEVSARVSVGDRGLDLLPPPPTENQGIGSTLLDFFMSNFRRSNDDKAVAVKHTVLAIAWLAINQALSPLEASKRQRPKRFWSGEDLSKLTLLRGLNDQTVRVGDKVRLKDAPENLLTRHGRTSDRTGTVIVDTFWVWKTETSVHVLWQDGKRECLKSTDLIPYLNPDEYDCWPGDHVIWKTEDEKHSAVIQTVNAAERTAEIVLYDGHRKLVSVLEIDAQGADANTSNPQDVFGVHRGDLVFIHREGDTNGCEKPIVPGIGELEEWVREIPVLVDVNGLGGWRKELDEIGQKIAQARSTEHIVDGHVKRDVDSSLNWFGEVSDLRVDGLIEVTLGDRRTITVPLERLTRLNDSLDQFEDLWGDELSDGQDQYMDDEDGGPLEFQTEDGQWLTYYEDDEGDWVDEDEPETTAVLADSENLMDVDDHETDNLLDIPDRPLDDIQPVATSSPKSTTNELTNGSASVGQSSRSDNHQALPSGPSSKRFDILPSAPADHAFYGSVPGTPSRQFLSRLTKEYRALSSSLPDSIIVQTYEDRTDLLRSVIIGPENTPYEDAPFVIDWMLDSNFPQTPPVAHFLSWTNGNGRVNPNLYEEGKVCLSILGTWTGDRSESWSPARSSLLQALVSIQGLVLVKEPWFCEPAYEKWRGTDEGKVNSRLYSEKAYVLSRGFVRRALEVPLGGLDEVIKDIYYTRGKLAKVVASAWKLIEDSRSMKERDENEDLAVPRLSAGGILTLSRTMDKLQSLLTSHGQL